MLRYQLQEEFLEVSKPYIYTVPNPVVGRAEKLGTNFPICGLYVEISHTKDWRSRDGTLHDLMLFTILSDAPYCIDILIREKNGIQRWAIPPAHQDESEEFYSAQLLHYGLKPQTSLTFNDRLSNFHAERLRGQPNKRHNDTRNARSVVIHNEVLQVSLDR